MWRLFCSWSRQVGPRIEFWVGEEVLWLKVREGGAWDRVLGGLGGVLAQGEGK
jgi:hypothetical protein